MLEESARALVTVRSMLRKLVTPYGGQKAVYSSDFLSAVVTEFRYQLCQLESELKYEREQMDKFVDYPICSEERHNRK